MSPALAAMAGTRPILTISASKAALGAVQGAAGTAASRQQVFQHAGDALLFVAAAVPWLPSAPTT